VYQEASKYNWNAHTMVAIAKAESGCRVSATGDTDLEFEQNGHIYGYSVSAFQIRILPGREACDSHDLQINVKCAYMIYKTQGLDAWSTVINGKYKTYL
jgi:hypothetical protein